MSMGKRNPERQQDMWVAATQLESRGHPFYRAINAILAAKGFDAFAEKICERFYTKNNGRPSIAPGVYFRMLLVGYFEGIGSERGIDWRCADSMSLHEFLGFGPGDPTPDHSTLSRTRRLIDPAAHKEIFDWVLKLIADEGLVSGKTAGIDSTTLEANAAMRSIVRRDTGQGYTEFLTELAKSAGIENPTREDLARLDRKRPKKGSNADWKHEFDPDAKIAKMKDGSTHMAHKLEQAVDIETGAVLAAEIHAANRGDTSTLAETLIAAAEAVDRLREDESTASKMDAQPLCEVVLDKGYHSDDVLVDLEGMAVRSYVSQPRMPKGRKRRWKDKNKEAERRATIANRRRITGKRGRELLRKRGELLERPFAHELESGGLRRTHVRGHDEVRKRIQIQAAAANLGLLMRTKCGIGAPRRLQGCARAVRKAFESAMNAIAAVGGLLRALAGAHIERLCSRRPRPTPPSAAMWLRRRLSIGGQLR